MEKEKCGITVGARQAFFDNSSAELHLSSGIEAHFQPLERKLLTELESTGLQDIRQVIPRNAGTHDDLTDLVADGVDLWDALDMVAVEAIEGREQPQRDIQPDRNGPWPAKMTEDLMRASISPDKRGSRSRSKRHGNPGPLDPLSEQTREQRKMAS
jgi:hypothetical protein